MKASGILQEREFTEEVGAIQGTPDSEIAHPLPKSYLLLELDTRMGALRMGSSGSPDPTQQTNRQTDRRTEEENALS